MSEAELLRLGEVIYSELIKQLGRDPRCMIDADHDLRAVVVDGSVDLIRVAAVVATRCCISLPEVETVAEVVPVRATAAG